jgi:methyl-accepting chemotaxis protein
MICTARRPESKSSNENKFPLLFRRRSGEQQNINRLRAFLNLRVFGDFIMRSMRSQFAIFAIALVSIVSAGGYLNYQYMIAAEEAEKRVSLVAQAIETHLTGTFFNEEGRAIIHGALGLYAFPPGERKQFYEKLRVNNADPATAFKSYASRSQDAVKANLARPLPPELRENFEKHLAAFQAYHAEIDKVTVDLPDSREKYVDALTRMNTLRSRIGDFRKLNSEALAKASATATADKDAAVDMQKKVLLGTFAGIVLMLAAFLALLHRQFGGFTLTVTKALEDFRANRPLSVKLAGAKTGEFAVVIRTLEEMQKKSEEFSEIQARETQELSERAERANALDTEVNAFKTTISGVVATMQSSAAAMRSANGGLQKVTGMASGNASQLVQSSEAADGAVETVAGAATEMTAAVANLIQRLRETVTVVEKASGIAGDTNQSVEQLNGAASKIGEVVSLIRAIAEQTNLLALNATIEAARAGESGRGFAVVASEVKNLATRTAQATEEIASQIAAIQETTLTSVTAIRAITEAVDEAALRTQDMAAMLEQQESAIQIIAESAEVSKRQTGAMLRSASEISGWIGEANQNAETVSQASETVEVASKDIDKAVQSFLQRVAA